MNCNTCRYHLSQCLDGRLPSGQRAAAMQHVEQCSECREFWVDLQAAQALTLRLQQPRVGADFREQLWERIHAGEGTPEAVFHEPVPIWTKIRYAATGAAAAAVVLLAMTWMRDRDAVPKHQMNLVSDSAGTSSTTVVDGPSDNRRTSPTLDEHGHNEREGRNERDRSNDPRERVFVADIALPTAARQLTLNLVAVEAARQLERRHAAVGAALRRLDDPSSNHSAAVSQAIENAEDFRAFGELLLDLRDNQRLSFNDTEVDADLRFAVKMLSHRGGDKVQPGGSDVTLQDRLDSRLQTVESVVAPALRSNHLAHIVRTIMVPPTINAAEELDALARLNRRRPEVFPKLFFVLGSADDFDQGASLTRHGMAVPGMALFMEDTCGLSWVAPRSEVEARDGLLRMLSSRGTVQIQIELPQSNR